jgi:hypothetical protein
MRGFAATIIIAGAAISFASPAWGDSSFNGSYSYTQTSNAPANKPPSTWTVSSTCAGAGCVAHVSSSGGWSTDFQMTGDKWIGSVLKPKAATCQDGSLQDTTLTYTIDPSTMTGTLVSDAPSSCLTANTATFSLVKAASTD